MNAAQCWIVGLALLLVGCGRGTAAPPLAAAPTQVTATLAPTFTPLPTLTPLPSATATASTTPPPTATATAAPTATLPPTAPAAPTPAVQAVTAQVSLPGITHEYQRLNNCGPTTAAMALSYYGLALTQYDLAPLLKGADSDKNVSPQELSALLQAQGLLAPVRVNGDLALLRALLSNGIPVIVEQWLERPDDALTGHYRLVRGYDQAAGLFLINDSYTGPNLRYSEADFDRWWRAFNRLYIPLYRAEQEALVRGIVGEGRWEQRAMWDGARQRAEAELAAAPDLYGWFNLGEARLRLDDAPGAIAAFDQASAQGLPERLLWYRFAPLEAMIVGGHYQRVLDLTEPLLGLKIEEHRFYRGLALEWLGHPSEARAEYQAAAMLNPRFQPALDALARLGG